MSAPEILEIEHLFAASDNANAVLRVRYYLDQIAASVRRCEDINGEKCSLCIERGRITADIRALLPAVEDVKT